MRRWEELEGERKEGEKNLLKTRVHQWEQPFSLPVTSFSLTEETRTDGLLARGRLVTGLRGIGEKRAEGASCAPGSGPISEGTLQLSQGASC